MNNLEERIFNNKYPEKIEKVLNKLDVKYSTVYKGIIEDLLSVNETTNLSKLYNDSKLYIDIIEKKVKEKYNKGSHILQKFYNDIKTYSLSKYKNEM